MVEHARAALPCEAVGLLGGSRAGRVELVLPVANIGASGTFLADPREQFLAEQELARAGAGLVAVYHSHPGGGTDPSPLDLAFARQRSCAHVVLAIDPPGRTGEELGAFAVRDSEAVEVEVRVRFG
jgi:proteasome lid subunit RPN8/RPN11